MTEEELRLRKQCFRKYVVVQLMLALTPKWNNVCIRPAYAWPHRRGLAKCGREEGPK